MKAAARERPVAPAVRKPGVGTISDPAVWLVRCPFCRRRHAHTAAVAMTEMVLPARCDSARFYLVQEVAVHE